MKVTELIVEQVIIQSLIVDYVNNTYVIYIYVYSDTISSFIHEYLVNLYHGLSLESSCYFNTLNTNDSIEEEVGRPFLSRVDVLSF